MKLKVIQHLNEFPAEMGVNCDWAIYATSTNNLSL